ncbi:MAG: hypothetical protein AB7F82_09345 [Alphaproteobacteria bacterium]
MTKGSKPIVTTDTNMVFWNDIEGAPTLAVNVRLDVRRLLEAAGHPAEESAIRARRLNAAQEAIVGAAEESLGKQLEPYGFRRTSGGYGTKEHVIGFATRDPEGVVKAMQDYGIENITLQNGANLPHIAEQPIPAAGGLSAKAQFRAQLCEAVAVVVERPSEVISAAAAGGRVGR